MIKKTTLFLVALSSLAVFCSCSFAQAPLSEVETPDKNFWLIDAPEDFPMQIRPGIRGGDGRTLSYADIFLPVVGTKDSFFFINPKIVLGSDSSNELNAGCGYRHLLFDESLILGGNFYYDTKHTENDFRHHQLGFGGEALTKWIDLRANFYFPVSGKKSFGDTLTYAFGQRSIIARTSTRYEEPLNGLDYEGGVLIPYLSDTIETRLYLGGYHYFSSLGNNINGIRGRLEAKLAPAFTFQLEATHNNIFGTDIYVGGYICLPVSVGNLFTGKNPFEGWREAIALGKGSRPLRKRMTDMVIRDLDVVLEEIETPPVETKLHDVAFVDANAAAGGDGTKDSPYDTIQDGVTNVTGDNWVYVTGGNYDENVVLTDNVTLWGAGYAAYSGLGGGANPVVTESTGGDIITLANNNEIMGFTMQNGGSYGIQATNAGNGTYIHHITIAGNTSGSIRVDIVDGATYSDFTISNNTMGGLTAIYAGDFVGNTGSITNVNIQNNTIINFAGSGALQPVAVGAGSKISDVIISGNTITGGSGRAVDISGVLGGHTDNVTILQNTIANNASYGLILISLGGGTCTNINLGDDTAGTAGYNSIYGNNGGLGNAQINNSTGVTIKGENNWWGTAAPVDADVFNPAEDPVDYTPFLIADPN